MSYRIRNLYLSKDYRKKLFYMLVYKLKESSREKVIKYINKSWDRCDEAIFKDLSVIIKEKDILDNKGSYRKHSIAKLVDDVNPSMYLDIGCLDGNITASMADLFELTKKQTHCVDIINYKKSEDVASKITYITYDGINIPYPDNSFDLVTCFMLFHHIDPSNIRKLMSEIKRVMKKGGVLIVREHDAENSQLFRDLLDLLHEYYDYVINTDNSWESLVKNNNFYESRERWEDLLLEFGFKRRPFKKRKPFRRHKSQKPTRVLSDPLDFSDIRNPFRNFIEIYEHS
jgi:ubiquinone/menaquinone biosynthesis C-methylase UbiE